MRHSITPHWLTPPRLTRIPLIPLALLLLATGCAKRHTTVNSSVERNPVVFESPTAADMFEDAMEDRYDRGEANVDRQVRLSANAFFNQQVSLADVDGDGIITEREAYKYAEN